MSKFPLFYKVGDLLSTFQQLVDKKYSLQNFDGVTLNYNMEKTNEERATALAKDLKQLISKYQHQSFVAHISFLANMHVRQGTGKVKLRSPVRMMMYLISLYHATEMKGTVLYAAGSKDHKRIIQLLNGIEKCYGYGPEKTKRNRVTKNDCDRLLVTKSTFLNYYVNASLSYVEQDIERIKGTFQHHDDYIFKETGIRLNEYIDFYLLLTQLEMERVRGYKDKSWDESDPITRRFLSHLNFRSLEEREKSLFVDFVDQRVFEMAIPMEDIYKKMDEKTAKQLMAYFTMRRNENPHYLYYTDECPYLKTPLLMMDGESILMVYSKQLINAIYEFLYDVCNDSAVPGRKISERRDIYLEEKTKEIFSDFFGPDATFYKGYYLNGSEKDLLALYNRTAYIIECKAHKQRPPMRNVEKSYERIKGDFEKSIGDGYMQASEVEHSFQAGKPFPLKNKQKKIAVIINPNDYDQVFKIIISQERLGQIQCDLGLLLKVDEDHLYPWAVSINDLESFLITLKRMDKPEQNFDNFLLSREQLHKRVLCSDELELCAYFLFNNEAFVETCKTDDVFISQPDMHKFFDLFYSTGFGFKEELNLAEKVKRRELNSYSVINFYKMKPAKRVVEFLQGQKSSITI